MIHCNECQHWKKQLIWHQPGWKICKAGNCVKEKTRACHKLKLPPKLIRRTNV